MRQKDRILYDTQKTPMKAATLVAGAAQGSIGFKLSIVCYGDGVVSRRGQDMLRLPQMPNDGEAWNFPKQTKGRGALEKEHWTPVNLQGEINIYSIRTNHLVARHTRPKHTQNGLPNILPPALRRLPTKMAPLRTPPSSPNPILPDQSNKPPKTYLTNTPKRSPSSPSATASKPTSPSPAPNKSTPAPRPRA